MRRAIALTGFLASLCSNAPLMAQSHQVVRVSRPEERNPVEVAVAINPTNPDPVTHIPLALALLTHSSKAMCTGVILMFVSVRLGFTPVHLSLLQPACVPDTVAGAVKTAALVVNVTVPFLIWSAGMVVGAVTGPTTCAPWRSTASRRSTWWS